MKILIDAMGGDNAPAEIVKGAVDASREFGVEVILVGKEEQVNASLEAAGGKGDPKISVANATEVVDMEDDPAAVIRRKKDSSITVALRMLSRGEGDAVISAGSTGALLTGATLIVKRIKGIRRAAMAPVLPNTGAGVLLIDCGANVECTPEYLLQFAYMGSFYAKSVLGYASPKIGLLNVGTEAGKGGGLQKEAHALLAEAHECGRINFVGNIEAKQAFFGEVDVIVTDGFSGNIMLKTIEGTAKFMFSEIKALFKSSKKAGLAAAMVKGELGVMKKRLDPNEVGGTALLGISKPVLKAHGSSDARAVRSAVAQAVSFVEAGIIEEINENIEHMSIVEG